MWDVPKEEEIAEVQELKKMQRVLVGKEPVVVPEHLYQKPTLRSSVEAPMPGLSYNPKEEDHQNLLKAAVLVEESKLRKEEKLAKKVTSNFVKKSDIDPNAWMKEMSQGLGSDDEEGEDDIETDHEETPAKKPVVCKRKTKAQRARESKHKMLTEIKNKKCYPANWHQKSSQGIASRRHFDTGKN